MSLEKRLNQGLALILATIFLITGSLVCAPEKMESASIDNSFQVASTAGVFASVSSLQLAAVESSVSEDASHATVVAATSDQAGELDDEYDEWSDKVIAQVNDYLSIREEASEDSAVVAKLRSGDIATLIDVFDGWYEIESGNAHGYVSADYCLTGIEAYKLAVDVCPSYATTTVAGLRIRSEASEDSKIKKVVAEGTKLIVNTDADEVEGWVAVTSADTVGYVKAEYVQVDMETGEAITLEEEAAAKAAAEEAVAKAKAAAEAASESNQAIIASADDVTLLAAIIQIEAGNECYEGQVAVGSVVCNRLRSGSYANSVSGVIFAKGQFSTSRMSSVISKGPQASCIQAAQEALAGKDTTGGATHFRRAGSKSGLIIGNHVFY